MKKTILILSLAFASTSCFSQNVKQDASGNYVAIHRVDSTNGPGTLTGKTYTDTKGVVYPVYITAKGKLYVIRTSKNTGKQYKQYLKVN